MSSRTVKSVNRDRKNSAQITALEMQKRYALLVTAAGEEEITAAAVDLGKLFNDNIDIIIWALRKAGGLDTPASTLPQMPAVFQ